MGVAELLLNREVTAQWADWSPRVLYPIYNCRTKDRQPVEAFDFALIRTNARMPNVKGRNKYWKKRMLIVDK